MPDGIDFQRFAEAVQVVAGIADADTLDASHKLNLDVPIDLLHKFPVAEVHLPQVLQLLHDLLVDLDEVLLPLAGLLGLADEVGEVLDLQLGLDDLEVDFLLVDHVLEPEGVAFRVVVGRLSGLGTHAGVE